MKRLFGNDEVQEAVQAFICYGIIALKGTKTPALQLAEKINSHLLDHDEISTYIGYQDDLPNHGYLYYLCDLNRFSILNKNTKKILYEIDNENPVN